MSDQPRFFISYRRANDAGLALLTKSVIEKEFGAQSVFVDQFAIRPGDDFRWMIERAVGNCQALIALIGHDWAPKRLDARHLMGHLDYVRHEVSIALRREIFVFPVLIDGAPVPDARSLPHDLCDIVNLQMLSMTRAGAIRDIQEIVETLRHRFVPEPQPYSPFHASPLGFEVALRAQKDPDVLALELVEAESEGSRDPEKWDELGTLLFQRGMLGQAKRCFERMVAIGQDNDNDVWHGFGCYGLTLVAEEQGEFEGALAYANQGVALVLPKTASPQGIDAEIEIFGIDTASPNSVQAQRDATWALINCTSIRHVQVLGALQSQIGSLAEARGDLAQADYRFRFSMAVGVLTADISSTVGAMLRVGSVARAQGELDRAEGWYRKALKCATDFDRPGLAAESQVALARVASVRGNALVAERHLEASLRQLEAEPDEMLRADTLRDLANLALQQGRLAEAETRHCEVLEIERSLGRQSKIASQLHNLAILAHARAELDGAERLYEEALEINRALPRPVGVAMQRMSLGLIHLSRGQQAEALTEFEAAVKIFEAVGHARHLGQALLNLGHGQESMKDYVSARKSFRRAAGLLDHAGTPEEQAKAWTRLARACSLSGNDPDDILMSATEAYRRSQAACDPVLTGQASYLIGALSEFKGDRSRARAAYLEALRLFEERAPDKAEGVRERLRDL